MSSRWRGESSRQGSRASCPLARASHGQSPHGLVGEETGLPLIQCLLCGMARVIELRAWTDENYGRIFFKCPNNMQGHSTTCPFYRFERPYLNKLVELGVVTFGGGVVQHEEEGEAESTEPVAASRMESQMETLIKIVKLLVFLVGAVVVVGVMYFMK